MKKEFLLEAMTDIREDFIMEAEEKVNFKKKKLPWKALLLAALIPILTVTAFAADFMSIRSLCTGPLHYTGDAYSDVAKAEKKAGFPINAPEALNDYTFRQIQVQDTRGLDENNKEVLRYREASVYYRNPAGNLLAYSVEPVKAEVAISDRPADQVRMVDGVNVEYRLDQYWFLPASVEETGLSQELKDWEQLPGHYISYGSEEPEQQSMACVSWEMDGLRYILMDMNARETDDTLYAMAGQILSGK